VNGFKYFYYFFRKEAFIPIDGEIFLEKVYKDSADYAQEIGDNLKDNVYKAMKILADGFFNWPENKLNPKDERTRIEVQKSIMRLLYRFLFLLYAEGKDLLDLKNKEYQNVYSFYRLKNEIKNKMEGRIPNDYSENSMTLWSKLKYLFNLINHGSESLGIPKSLVHIPPYNGGLFDPQKNSHLEKWNIGDIFLANAIDLLTCTKINGGEIGFVDYSTLEIRHLGSIYEGLLEYKLKLAERDMVVKGREKKREWMTLEEFNKGRTQKKSQKDFEEFDRVLANELYLATDKGERKATGSYYTPDYIVNYIVENTVGVVVKEKWKEATQNDKSIIDSILTIKILDPAMGSGHFLVGTVEFLSGKLLEAVQKDIERGLVEDDGHYTIDWAKREVVSHCIYGTDLNDLAVELARVALWLSTISKDKPLSFIDHHLKCGNSLIGAKIVDLAWLPKERPKGIITHVDKPLGLIDIIIKRLQELEKISDDTVENIRHKEELFQQLMQSDEYRRLKTLADVHTGLYFIDIDFDDIRKGYMELANEAYFGNPEKWDNKFNVTWAKAAKNKAQERIFFHWELEFPEIFFEDGQIKKNPGFDAVIGNPPYGAEFDKYDRNYIEKIYPNSKNNKNSAMVFIEAALKWMHSNSMFGMIVPKSLTFSQKWETGRELVLSRLICLCDASKAFEDVLLEQVVVILSKEKNHRKSYLTSYFSDLKGTLPVIINKHLCNLTQTLLISINKHDINIFQKITSSKLYLGNISDTSRGLPFQKYLLDKGNYKTFRGDHISRYNLSESKEYLNKDNLLKAKNKVKFLNQPKVISQRIVAHVTKPIDHIIIMATIDKDGVLTVDTVENTVINDKRYSLGFVTALLNSTLISWYAYRFIFNRAIRTMDFDNYYVGKIPIPSVNIVTSKERQNTHLIEAKHFYQDYLSSNNLDSIQDFIKEHFPKYNSAIYDIITHLAEQMTKINKLKNEKIKDFIEWLEREINSTIEILINKTKITQYYTLEFDELLGVLKKNKKKIPINLSNSEFQRNLKREFERSISVLYPLTNKIRLTDKLIDHIVYKLYGLTDDEIEIVEESVGKK